MKYLVPVLLFCFLACAEETTTSAPTSAPNYVIQEHPDSDPAAIGIARQVEAAMGGREAYDALPVLRFNFFGRRTLTWDKHRNRVRIDVEETNTTYDLNIGTGEAETTVDGTVVTDAEQQKAKSLEAMNIYINDTYWLVMPWKLRDSKVILKKLTDRVATDSTTAAHVLELTFDAGAGLTPQNKYHVFVDPTTKLVNEWHFFPTAADSEPRLMNSWGDYQEHRGVLLSGDRMPVGMLTDIAVLDEL